MDRNQFSSNAAEQNGGPEYLRLSNVVKHGSNFSNNVGETIYLQSSDITIDESQFSVNTAHDEGGALWSTLSNISIAGSQLYTNKADYGGTMSLYSSINCHYSYRPV